MSAQMMDTPRSRGIERAVTPAPGPKRPYEIQLVSSAFAILEQFSGDTVELGVTDISKRTLLTKNKVFRLLSTLKDLNYIDQNQRTGNYRLGFQAMKLSQTVGRQVWWLDQARSVMEQMARESGETVCFSILRDFDTVALEAIEGSRSLRVIPSIGLPSPSYCCASGKALLAYVGEEKLKRYLSGNKLAPHTSFTVTDPFLLADQLREVADQGYALEDRESDLGVAGVAAPIRDYALRIVGAVSLAGPVHRFDKERLEQLVPLLLDGATQISAKLGYAPLAPEPAVERKDYACRNI